MCGAAFHDPKSSHFGSSLTNRSRHGRSAKRRRLWCLAASPPPMPRRDRVLISTWSWPWPANVPDPLNVQTASNRTTPASYEAALRAHFLQGHRWVQQGTLPPASTHLSTSRGNKLDRDANGNAIAVDANGRRVPRLPFIELGEARYISGFRGSYDGVKTIADLGFASHHAYVTAFADKLADYVKAGYILNEDAAAMRNRA